MSPDLNNIFFSVCVWGWNRRTTQHHSIQVWQIIPLCYWDFLNESDLSQGSSHMLLAILQGESLSEARLNPEPAVAGAVGGWEPMSMCLVSNCILVLQIETGIFSMCFSIPVIWIVLFELHFPPMAGASWWDQRARGEEESGETGDI